MTVIATLTVTVTSTAMETEAAAVAVTATFMASEAAKAAVTVTVTSTAMETEAYNYINPLLAPLIIFFTTEIWPVLPIDLLVRHRTGHLCGY